jgi:hypothetical protein
MIIRSKEFYQHGIINTTTVYNLLRSDGSIVINKALMQAIGINEAIIYCELLSRYGYFQSRQQLTEDGFFFNTIEDLQSATTLSGYQQRKSISTLIQIGLIDMQVKGIPPKRYFKIVDNMELLISLLSQNNGESSNNEETKQLKVKELDGNNTNVIIQKNNNDNGSFPERKQTKNTWILDAMKVYMNDLYPQRKHKKHPNLKPYQYDDVYTSISAFVDEHCLDDEALVEMMVSYLNDKTLDTDWNINHFATEGIMLNRFYNAGLL